MFIPDNNQKYTALIVDDNFHNRHIFRIALEAVGYTVDESEDGLMGIERLNRECFHLLILDLHMPKMDGQQVLRTLRKDPRHTQMQVVVVTANAHMATDDVSELADFIMVKPIDVVQFAELAKRLRGMHVA
ncbi:MAG TPA: response regulator [Aggregatilineales bacterium]|nr:response regulator [Aggregatilineales bacterium]